MERTPEGARMLRPTRTLAIPVTELDVRTSRSSGPGGQHVNTAATRVEVRFDIASSTSLGPRQRARLLAAYGPVLRCVASGERSQLRNRAAAIDRLCAKLAGALATPRRRIATTPSAAERERRLTRKHRRSERKAARNARPEPGGDFG